jgi:manganese/iron transport system permease protein
MLNWLIEPLQHGFMRQALLASIMVGLTCSSLGVYVVLRRMAFLGDAIAHTTLPGLVIAYLNRWSLLGGAIISAVITALGIGWLSRNQRLREDTAIGVVFSGMFALGIVMVSRAQSYRDFSHMLFGNVLGVTQSDLFGIGAVCIIVLGTLFMVNKELALTTIDPHHAQTIGLSAERMRYLLLVMLALAIVAGIQSVGVVMTTALMVTPAAAASLITCQLRGMFIWSGLLSVLSNCIGLYVSYYFSVSSGGAIVLSCTSLFGFIFIVTHFKRLSRNSNKNP